MLQKLIVHNYAIIDHLVIEPDKHLNTVTGETGAGKSIILGALSLILGERADSSVLINKNEKCVVEAYFEVKGHADFHALMLQEELDDDDLCIIRREINAAGKSRAFVNDTPVTLNLLGKLTSLLVDLHQQFDHLALEEDHFQMDVLDAIAQNGSLNEVYKGLFLKYRKITEELTHLKQRQEEWRKESDYKQFLLDELVPADFKSGEVEHADLQLKQLSHAERIISVLQTGKIALEEGEQPIVNELKRIGQQLHSIADVLPEVNELQVRLASTWAELKDISDEFERLEGKVNLDPALMAELQERIDLGYRLFKKHGISSTDELIALQERLQAELKTGLDLNDSIEQLTKEQFAAYTDLIATAEKLSVQRKKVAPQIAEKINTLLALVGMPNARLSINIIVKTQPAQSGIDEVTFLLDANKSGQFMPIHKVASGGEMSRIMLCIKSLTAKAMKMPTLIFDEADTGISGEAARQVGILLRDLAKYHQVICITHQPQVAAKGSCHFHVYKEEDDKKRITTKVRVLKLEERVLAIARMIGGEKPSDAALQNAKELVEL